MKVYTVIELIEASYSPISLRVFRDKYKARELFYACMKENDAPEEIGDLAGANVCCSTIFFAYTDDYSVSLIESELDDG
jgi:hypothetical protein